MEHLKKDTKDKNGKNFLLIVFNWQKTRFTYVNAFNFNTI